MTCCLYIYIAWGDGRSTRLETRDYATSIIIDGTDEAEQQVVFSKVLSYSHTASLAVRVEGTLLLIHTLGC